MPTATKRPKAPATDSLTALADGCTETLRFLKWLRKAIRAAAKAVDDHEDLTAPPVEQAEKVVKQIEKRISAGQVELDKAQLELGAARRAHDQDGEHDERCRRLDALIYVAPAEVLAPIFVDDGGDEADAPVLTSYASVWGEFFLDGDPLREHGMGLLQYSNREPGLQVQVHDAIDKGIPAALVRAALRRWRDSVDGAEAVEVTAALVTLRELES